MDLKYLIEKTNKHFDCDIRINTRKRDIVMARGAFFWLAKHTTNKSLKAIGEAVGRDHTSVVYGLANFNDWIRWDQIFNANFEALKMIVLNKYKKNNFNAETLIYKYNCLMIENEVLKNEIKKLKSKI